MGFDFPKFTDSVGASTIAEEGGGGGSGGDPFNTWISLPVDPANGWTTLTGAGAVGMTASLVSGQLHVRVPGGQNTQWTGATKRGLALVRTVELKPWAGAGVAVPAGSSDFKLYPESVLLKVEAQFDYANEGAISGGGSGYQEGRYLQCTIGVFHYASDQGGSPIMPGADENTGAMVYKYGAVDPMTSTNIQEYRSGYNHYNGRGVSGGYKWRMQPTAGSNGHDAIVHSVGLPVGARDTYDRYACGGGSYATQNPTAVMCQNGTTSYSNSTKFLNRHIHIAIHFGSYNAQTSNAGLFRITKIRYLLQAIDARETLTAV